MNAKLITLMAACIYSHNELASATQLLKHHHKGHSKDSSLTQIGTSFIDGEEEMSNDADLSAQIVKNEIKADVAKKEPVEKKLGAVSVKESNIVVDSLDSSEEDLNKTLNATMAEVEKPVAA